MRPHKHTPARWLIQVPDCRFVLEGMMEGGTGRPAEARLAGDDVVARAGITQQLALCRVDPPSRNRAGAENSMQGCRPDTAVCYA